MKKTTSFIFVIVFLFSSSTAFAQIEIGLTEANIGIGSGTPTTNYKLNLQYSFSSAAKRGIYVKNTSTADVDAVAIEADNDANPGYGFGGKFYGGWVGIKAYATQSGGSRSSRYGLWGTAQGGPSNYGVVGEVVHNSAGISYGVYGKISGDSSNYAGYFVGNVYATGTMTELSDGRAKENKRSLEDSNILEEVLKLNPVSYTYKQTDEYDRLSLPMGNQYGFLSEEVEQVFPELVKSVVHIEPFDADDPQNEGKEAPEALRLKALNYTGLIPLLVRAIQEQQAEIEELKALISNR